MPVVVITGDEEFLRGEEMDAALARVKDAEILRLDADTESRELSAVLDELRMRSLFGGRKAVVIEGEKFLTANAESLASFIKKEMPKLEDVLLVVSADKVPSGIATAAKKSGEVKEVKKMYSTDYHTGRPSASSPFGVWVRQRAAKSGLQLDEEAVLRVIEASGENSRAAAGLLDTLSGRGGKKATAEDIDALMGGEGAAVPYRLEDAVLAGNLAEALDIADSAYRYGIVSFDKYTQSEGSVTGMLMRVLVQAVTNLTRLKEDSSEAAARTLRIFKPRYNRYTAALKRIKADELVKLLDDAFRAEFVFKSGIMGGKEMVEWLSARICGADVRSPESFGEILSRH
jgi:DNA polymerase III delta subunit